MYTKFKVTLWITCIVLYFTALAYSQEYSIGDHQFKLEE